MKPAHESLWAPNQFHLSYRKYDSGLQRALAFFFCGLLDVAGFCPMTRVFGEMSSVEGKAKNEIRPRAALSTRPTPSCGERTDLAFEGRDSLLLLRSGCINFSYGQLLSSLPSFLVQVDKDIFFFR